jgi:3-hydroxyisobutyrate dehydrogenase-like beta-hydroxyacid dehydrogenase
MIDTSEVGIVGIGLLGSAIAQRLINDGCAVHGYDSDNSRLESFVAHGGLVLGDAAQVIRSSQLLVFSLPTSETIASIVDRYRTCFQSGQIVIDTTTGNPQQVIAIGRALAEIGVEYVEATVAGSSDQMREGQATLFVGGNSQIIDQLQSILQILADNSFYLGPVGSASRMKLVHNLVLGLHRAVLAEGLTFAKAMGIEPSDALQILTQTPAASAVMETKGLRMVNDEFAPQARLAQHLKDVHLILAESQRAHCKTPLSELHQSLLQTAVELGLGDLDNSAIIKVFGPAEASEE